MAVKGGVGGESVSTHGTSRWTEIPEPDHILLTGEEEDLLLLRIDGDECVGDTRNNDKDEDDVWLCRKHQTTSMKLKYLVWHIPLAL